MLAFKKYKNSPVIIARDVQIVAVRAVNIQEAAADVVAYEKPTPPFPHENPHPALARFAGLGPAMLLATRLYEQNKLSLGQAAEMAGYSKRAFMEVLGDYNVSIFNLSAEDLENDVRNAGHHHS